MKNEKGRVRLNYLVKFMVFNKKDARSESQHLCFAEKHFKILL